MYLPVFVVPLLLDCLVRKSTSYWSSDFLAVLPWCPVWFYRQLVSLGKLQSPSNTSGPEQQGAHLGKSTRKKKHCIEKISDFKVCMLTLKCSSSTLFFIMSSREIAWGCPPNWEDEADPMRDPCLDEADPTRDPCLELRTEESGRERYLRAERDCLLPLSSAPAS